jgi:PAS domain S-box-containing protein
MVSSVLVAEGRYLRSQNDELFEQQQRAQAARDNFAELYDNASEALLSVASAGLIRTANLAAAELLGRERTRLVGFPLRLFVHREDRAQLARLLSHGEGAAVMTVHARLITRDAVKTCRLVARRSRLKPDVTYLMLLPKNANDGRG